MLTAQRLLCDGLGGLAILYIFSTYPKLEFIACVRTQADIGNIATYMPSNGATKLAFLIGKPLPTML